MPSIPKNAQEESTNSLEEMTTEAVKGMIPYPTFVCGVNRKVNTGNYENLDIYAGIAVPIMAFPHDGEEEFKNAVAEAAEMGFLITSREAGDRYQLIKDLQSGGREEPKPEAPA